MGAFAIVGTLRDLVNFPNPLRVATDGEYAYIVINTTYHLAVVDIRTPTAPSYLGRVATGAFSGHYLVVNPASTHCFMSHSGGITVINVTNKSAPSVTSTFAMSPVDDAQMALSGNYLYVLGGASGNTLSIVDVSNPAALSVVGSVTDATNLNHPAGVAVLGSFAYVASKLGDRLTVVDVSTPSAPVIVGNVSSGTNLDTAFRVSVIDSAAKVFVGTEGGGTSQVVTVVDASTPTVPSVALALGSHGGAVARDFVALNNDYGLVVNHAADQVYVQSLSVAGTFPANVVSTTHMDIGPDALAYRSGEYAVGVTEQTDYLVVFDVGDYVALRGWQVGVAF